MAKKYIYNDKEYYSIAGLRNALPNVSIPIDVSDEMLKTLGVIVIDLPAPPPVPLSIKKQICVDKVHNNAFEKRKEYLSQYSDVQIETFDRQKQEADQIVKTPDESYPDFLITQLAELEGSSPHDYAKRVLSHAEKYRILVYEIVKIERDLYKQITDCETEEELENIDLETPFAHVVKDINNVNNAQ